MGDITAGRWVAIVSLRLVAIYSLGLAIQSLGLAIYSLGVAIYSLGRATQSLGITIEIAISSLNELKPLLLICLHM